jgi:hypothetical protein
MGSYQQHALEGASAVDLVVALYDGILRFLYAASAAVERGDQAGRRNAVKRALDIIIHLQARLRMDVGGRPAGAGAERVLRIDLCADLASIAVGVAAEVRTCDRVCAQRAGCVAAGGAGPGGQSRAGAGVGEECREEADGV